MRKLLLVLTVIGMFGFQGCSGPEGPPGAPGQDGLISTVYETKQLSFVPSNYSVRFVFPTPIYESDVVLVYRLTGTANGVDLWEFLPETHYFSDGTRNFSYNFDFTRYDVQIYLEGNNLQTLDSSYRLNQIFRVVAVPANLIYGIDKNNYGQVMSSLKLKESQVQMSTF